jgi:hypothetical protein
MGNPADSATISFTTDNAENATVSAAAQAHPRSVIGDTGLHYVLLVGPKTLGRLPDNRPVMSAATTITTSTAWGRGSIECCGSDADNDGRSATPAKPVVDIPHSTNCAR